MYRRRRIVELPHDSAIVISSKPTLNLAALQFAEDLGVTQGRVAVQRASRGVRSATNMTTGPVELRFVARHGPGDLRLSPDGPARDRSVVVD